MGLIDTRIKNSLQKALEPVTEKFEKIIKSKQKENQELIINKILEMQKHLEDVTNKLIEKKISERLKNE